MKAIYINPKGIVCYLPNCPEEPKDKCKDYHTHFLCRWTMCRCDDDDKAYRQALAAAKQSAVPFVDQQQGRDLICYELYGGPQIDIPWSVTVKNHSDKIFDFPSGWEVVCLRI